MGLCALAKKSDNLELQVLLPDGRTPGLSYGGIGTRRTRFFVHTPCVAFNYNDLYDGQKPSLDYVTKDADDNPQKGVLILQGDVLGLYHYDSDTEDLNLDDYKYIPKMQEIYWDKGGVYINPTLTNEHNNVNGLVARMAFNRGVVSTYDAAESYFKFTDRPDSKDGSVYDDGYDFHRVVRVRIHITSESVDLLVGDTYYNLRPATEEQLEVTVTIANMPPGRIAVDKNDLTVLDDTKEDYDFELVYSVAYPKPSRKPRVPIKYRDKPKTTKKSKAKRDNDIGDLPPAGTRPPLICSLAGFNDYD